MPRATIPPTTEFVDALLEAFAIDDRMNQLILDHLDPRAWRATLPATRNARTIAALFAHMHNIRRKWIRLTAPHLKLPPPLNRARSTPRQTRIALRRSAKQCSMLLQEALGNPSGPVRQFRRDGWARPWPAGPSMFAYMLTHDAHHRGQICMLAHQLGFPLPNHVNYGLWAWERLASLSN